MSLSDSVKQAFIESYGVLKAAATEIVGYDQAEDVVHDAFIALMKSKASFRDESKIQTFLYKAVRNMALSTVRAKSRGIQGKTLKPFDNGRTDRNAANSAHDIACKIAASKVEDSNKLLHVSEILTADDLRLMEFRKLGKKWYLKAAEAMQISPGNVRVRFTRLSQKLKENAQSA